MVGITGGPGKLGANQGDDLHFPAATIDAALRLLAALGDPKKTHAEIERYRAARDEAVKATAGADARMAKAEAAEKVLAEREQYVADAAADFERKATKRAADLDKREAALAEKQAAFNAEKARHAEAVKSGHAELLERETKVGLAEAEIADSRRGIEAEWATAQKARAEAEALRTELEDKLAKLKALAG